MRMKTTASFGTGCLLTTHLGARHRVESVYEQDVNKNRSPAVTKPARRAGAMAGGFVLIGAAWGFWDHFMRMAHEARVAAELKEACIHVWQLEQKTGKLPGPENWRGVVPEPGSRNEDILSPLVFSVASRNGEWLFLSC